MPSPMAEQIFDAMETALEAIVGDGGTTYSYTPAAVVRAHAFTAEVLDPSVSGDRVIYCLIPGDQQETRPGAFSRVRLSQLPVTVIAAKRFDGATDNPFSPPSPSRWEVQELLIRDAERALLNSDSLNGRGASPLAICLDVPERDRSTEETFVEGWALALLRVEVLYQYQDTAP